MPESTPGVLATLWTVRLAMGCYLVRALADGVRAVRSREGDSDSEVSHGHDAIVRIVWTFGAVLLAVHVVLVFAVFHGWSHAAAWEHTADRTEAFTGWRWGGGLYLNHVILLWWAVDAALWWANGHDFAAGRGWYRWSLHAFFGFMVFNATVVFGPRPWTWVAVAFGLAFTATLFAERGRRLRSDTGTVG